MLNSCLVSLTLWFAQAAEMTPELPSEFADLVRDRVVSLEYVSDPDFVSQDIGHCEFKLSFLYEFKYQSHQIRRNGKTRLLIIPRVLAPSAVIRHQIRIPIRYAQPGEVSERLLRHEFDHVAVGIDPRPALLLKHLASNLPPISYTVPPGVEVDDELISRLIREALDARRAAVNTAICRSNELLDELSQHGVVSLEQREKFFAELYTKERLAQQRFPYLDEALKVFATQEYDDAQLPSFVTNSKP